MAGRVARVGWSHAARAWGKARAKLPTAHALVVLVVTGVLVARAWDRVGRHRAAVQGEEGARVHDDVGVGPVGIVPRAEVQVHAPVCGIAGEVDVCVWDAVRRGWMVPWAVAKGWRDAVVRGGLGASAGTLLARWTDRDADVFARMQDVRASISRRIAFEGGVSVAAGAGAVAALACTSATMLAWVLLRRKREGRERREAIQLLLREGVRVQGTPPCVSRGEGEDEDEGEESGGESDEAVGKGTLPPRQLFGSPVSMRGERFFSALEDEEGVSEGGEDGYEGQGGDDEVVPATSGEEEEEVDDRSEDLPRALMRSKGKGRGRRARDPTKRAEEQASLRALVERETAIRDVILKRYATEAAAQNQSVPHADDEPEEEEEAVPEEPTKKATVVSAYRLRGRVVRIADTGSQNADEGSGVDSLGDDKSEE